MKRHDNIARLMFKNVGARAALVELFGERTRARAVGFIDWSDDSVESTEDRFNDFIVIIGSAIPESRACPVEQPRARYLSIFGMST